MLRIQKSEFRGAKNIVYVGLTLQFSVSGEGGEGVEEEEDDD